MTTLPASNVDADVTCRPGAIIVNTVDRVVNDPHAKVYVVDCTSKYFDEYTSTPFGGIPEVNLVATDRTLNLDPKHATEAPTVLTFPGLVGWSAMVELGRYEATIILWEVDPALDGDTGDDGVDDTDDDADTVAAGWVDPDGVHHLITSGRNSDSYRMHCGDYPAPCNCDDPTTHNGHQHHPAPDFLAEWLEGQKP